MYERLYCGECDGSGWVIDPDEYEPGSSRCRKCGGVGLNRQRVIDALGLSHALKVADITREERDRFAQISAANAKMRRALRRIVNELEERTETPKMEPRVEDGKVVLDLVPDDIAQRMGAIADEALHERGRLRGGDHD